MAMEATATTRRAQRGMVREWRLHVLSVFSLAVAFVCLGAALLVLTNLRAVEERWARAGRASIYLKDNAAPADVEALRAALAGSPGVKSVKVVTSAEARAEFLSSPGTGKSDLAAVPTEAFPSSLDVEVESDVSQDDVNHLVDKARLLPFVDDVETYQAWTDRLARLVRGGVAAAVVLAVVVFASVLAVVGSTIRLALQRRRTEVEVLRLVGATDRFIRGPFLLEGSAQGALGAVFALMVLAVLFLLVRGRLDGELAALLGIEPAFLPWQAALGLVVVGSLLGRVAASIGLRKLVSV